MRRPGSEPPQHIAPEGHPATPGSKPERFAGAITRLLPNLILFPTLAASGAEVYSMTGLNSLAQSLISVDYPGLYFY